MRAMSDSLQQLQSQLANCMLADRHALRRKLRDVADLQKLANENSMSKAQRLLGEIAQKINKSQQKYQQRLVYLPKPE